jgi:hypothetical protein
LSQESCLELHQPANSTIGANGYGWFFTEREWANGLVCMHPGTNTLNYYVVWLAFNLSRAFVGFTNGGRFNDTDALMVDDAVVVAIFGDQQCDARIPSSVYITNNNGTDAPPEGPANVPTSAPVDMSDAGGSMQGHFWFHSLFAFLLLAVTLDIV